MRVLLVEDEEGLSQALVEIFKKNRISIDAVLDGKEGLKYAESGIGTGKANDDEKQIETNAGRSRPAVFPADQSNGGKYSSSSNRETRSHRNESCANTSTSAEPP